jgi:hypothetical protein
MYDTPFTSFDIFVVEMRLKTMVKAIQANNREKVIVLLEDTICHMENLPCDYDEVTKIRLLERIEIALMLLWLGNLGDVCACLKEAQEVCRDFVNAEFQRNILSCNDKSELGALDALPFDVRQVILAKVCA